MSQFSQSNTLVVIDGNVPAYSTLIARLDSYTKYIVLDTNQDGIEQITTALGNSPAINTLHIVSHGRPDCIEIINNTLRQRFVPQLQKLRGFNIWASNTLRGYTQQSGNRNLKFRI